jgi:hypothetical protein
VIERFAVVRIRSGVEQKFRQSGVAIAPCGTVER